MISLIFLPYWITLVSDRISLPRNSELVTVLLENHEFRYFLKGLYSDDGPRRQSADGLIDVCRFKRPFKKFLKRWEGAQLPPDV